MGEAKRRRDLNLPPREKRSEFPSPRRTTYGVKSLKEGEKVSIDGIVYEKFNGSLHKFTPLFIKKRNASRRRQRDLEELRDRELQEDLEREAFDRYHERDPDEVSDE